MLPICRLWATSAHDCTEWNTAALMEYNTLTGYAKSECCFCAGLLKSYSHGQTSYLFSLESCCDTRLQAEIIILQKSLNGSFRSFCGTKPTVMVAECILQQPQCGGLVYGNLNLCSWLLYLEGWRRERAFCLRICSVVRPKQRSQVSYSRRSFKLLYSGSGKEGMLRVFDSCKFWTKLLKITACILMLCFKSILQRFRKKWTTSALVYSEIKTGTLLMLAVPQID